MTRSFLALLAATFLASAVPAPAANSPRKPWTTDDILAMRTVVDPRISPDGKWVAYVVYSLRPAGYQSDVWLAPVAGGEARRLTSSPAADESPRWSPDGRTLAFLSDRPHPGRPPDAAGLDEGRRQIWMIRVDGGEAWPASNAPGGVNSFEWSGDGGSLAFLSSDPKSAGGLKAEPEGAPRGKQRRNRLWVMALSGEGARAVTPADSEAVAFAVSPDGRRVVVALQTEPGLEGLLDTNLYLVPAAGGPLTPLVRRVGMDTSPRWSPDGRWIAFASQEGRDREWFSHNSVCVIAAAGGEPRSITRDFDECVEGLGAGGLAWMPDSRAVVFFAVQRTAQHVMRAGLDGAVRPLTAGDCMNHSPSVDSAGNLAFVSEDSEHPADVWLLSAGGAPRRLTDTNPEARERLAFRTTLVRWQGADGGDLEGLLVLPPGARPGRRLPLVLHAHGGPSDAHGHTCTASSRGFPHALWAQKGWAILLPNPRGSGGYGEAFRAAIRRDWGGIDAEDLIRGVDALIERGIADPARLAVCGWSYGGFMAATLVTKTDRFRAAVVGAGVTNLTSMVGTCDLPGLDRSYFGAWPWEDPQIYIDHSPLFHAARVTTPTLILHGEMDDRVPVSQGFEFHHALRKLGVPTEMRLLPRSGHVPHEPGLLKVVQESQLEWFDRWTRTPASGP